MLKDSILPQDILKSFVEAAREIIGGNLLGVYLHCSAAMGCYNITVEAFFAPVPAENYFDSIQSDAEDAESEITENTEYLLLNLAQYVFAEQPAPGSNLRDFAESHGKWSSDRSEGIRNLYFIRRKKMTHKEKALDYFGRKFHCSQAVLAAFAEECGLRLRLQHSPDYSQRYGSPPLHELRLCKKRTLYAV